MSRIYIGSINFDIGEDHLRMNFSPFGPIKVVFEIYALPHFSI